MNDHDVEQILASLKIGDLTLKLASRTATNVVRETRRQCAEGQSFARIVRVLEAETAKRAVDAMEVAA